MIYFNFVCLLIIFIISLSGVVVYKKIAMHYGILANTNFRTLHVFPIPEGGGIVFSAIFVIGLLSLWWLGQLSVNLILVFGVGGGLASLFGFFDDVKDIRASNKMVVQFLLSGWALFWFDGWPLLYFEWLPQLVVIPLTAIFLVWMINAYNFMDGIDGMAVSGTVFVSGTITLVMLMTNGSSELIIVTIMLFTCTSAFLIFNWPSASIFMGDSGSVFLGYIFGSLILVTVNSGYISIWTWLIVFGYYFADTTVTQLMRIILVKKWYLPHRSHAYQNLARITGSHLKVTGGVVLYNVVWILPLTIWSVMKPEMALFALALAIAPSLVFAFKYGPLLSSS